MWSLVDASEPLTAPAPVKVVRDCRLVERVVFVGGLAGCGKTMMTPIVGSFAGVEMQKFDYTLEYICTLRLLGCLDEPTTTTMIRMLTDLNLYNMVQSREVNLRFSDLSSIFRNPGTWRYLRRMVQPGDAAAVERIRREHPILHVALHYTLTFSPPLLAALGDAARIVEVVRHPVYLVKPLRNYLRQHGLERDGMDARDFTIWIERQGSPVPFFAHGWEERYRQSNPMDRSIYAVEHLLRVNQQTLGGFSESQRRQVMVVPFERFVLDPWSYLTQMGTLLGTRVTALTRRELKRQRVPRQRISDGAARLIYRQYGWEPPKAGASDRQELDQRRQAIAAEASPDALQVLDRLSAEYEAAYLCGTERW